MSDRRLALEAALPRPERGRRKVWRRGGRAHIELRAIDRDDVVAEAQRRLTAVDAVQSVVVHPATGRLVVSFDPESARLEELVGVVEEAERACGTDTSAFSRPLPDHPGDIEPFIREGAALAADVAAAGLAFAGRLARVARLPVEAASLVSVVQSQPRLRGALESVLGTGAAQLPLAVANAVAQGLAQGPLGLVADGAIRVSLLAEHKARRDLWGDVESELVAADGSGPDPAGQPDGDRPAPMPGGPIEQYADRALVAGAGGMAAATLATGSVRRGLSTFLAATPKAAVQGREVFAARLGAVLAERGLVCVDASVLRRIDRVDCLLLDARALRGGHRLGRVVAVHEAGDVAELTTTATRLWHANGSGQPDGPWNLRRLTPRSALRRRLDFRRALNETGAEDAYALVHDGVPVAAVGLERDDPSEALARLTSTARAAGWMAAVYNPDGDALVDVRGCDLLVTDGSLLAAVRGLQADGCVVALVSQSEAGLRAADCGIGLCDAEAGVPWGADVLCRGGIADAHAVVEAAAIAHEVSRQSAAIALAGSSIGAVLGFTVPAPMAASRVMNAVNVAALVAQANALRAAKSLRSDSLSVAPPAPPWHSMAADDVLAVLGTSRSGLSRKTAASRRRAEDDQGVSLPGAMLDELANPLTPVLAGAAALSAAVGSPTDAAIVGTVTAVNAVLGGTQRWRVDRAVQAMEERSGQQVRAMRSGKWLSAPAETLVPGDVIALQSGDSVPGDCRLLVAEALEVDESSVTGESVPVTKSADPSDARTVADRTSMLYDGTTVATGRAEAVVVAVGRDTELGRAAAAAERESEPTTGVESRLSGLVARALPLSALGGAAATTAGLLRGVPLRETLHSGVGLAVAAVPEGLPLLGTIAQVSAARRLAAKNVLVRNPRAIEALGRVDVLCADKTGTLTEGRITLRRVSDGRQDVALDELTPHHCYVLASALRASPAQQDGDPLPHLTDRAVVEGAERAGVQAGNGGHPWERRAELHFEPARGFHAVLGRNGDGFLLSVKGAPEVILPRCDEWNDGTSIRPLTDTERRAVAEHVEAVARCGYRVLAVAERRASGQRDLAEDRVARLTFLGLVALADPVRPSAADAVRRLREAGVRTVMVTGDHPSTAEGIAAELGILDGGGVLVGPELDELDDDALAEMLPSVTVFARVTPAHKLRLVRAYRAAGHAVAMTGDGANDAPAIRLADVGVALGENSTSGARRAADLVVPDGRIEALLDGVVEGRAMWASVREAVAILLGGNLGETAFTVATAAISGRPALNARQLLLVNLLTDALPAMAIASRAPRDVSPRALLAEGPDASLGRALDHAIISRAATTASAAGIAWIGARVTGSRRRAGSVALGALVGTQLAQTLLQGGKDPWVAAAALGSATVLVGIVQTPGLSQVFGCTPLGPVGWGIAAGATAAGVAAGAIVPAAWRVLRSEPRPLALSPAPAGQPAPNERVLVLAGRDGRASS